MVVKKKKQRMLRAGAVDTSAGVNDTEPTEDADVSVEVDSEAPSEETDTQPDSGIGGRANRVRAKKVVKKAVKKTAPQSTVVADTSDDDSELEVMETDTTIANAKHLLARIDSGLEEVAVHRFWMKNKKLLVATIVTTDPKLTKVEIEPTSVGQELAQAIFDDIEGDGEDPSSIDVAEEGWKYEYQFSSEDEDE